MPLQLNWPLKPSGVILNTDRTGVKPKYLERLRVRRLRVDICRRGKRKEREGEWRRRQSSTRFSSLRKSRAACWDSYRVGDGMQGEPTCGGLVPGILGNPPEWDRRPRLATFVHFIPKKVAVSSWSPQAPISYRRESTLKRKTGQMTQGILARRTHMFLCVWGKPLHPINPGWLCRWNRTN